MSRVGTSVHPPAVQPAGIGRFLTLDNRYLAPVLVTGILLVGQLSFGILESYPKTAAAIGTAILVEGVLARLVFGAWPSIASAYITGISVGMLIRSPDFWPYVLCSMLAITSKYALRFRDRHIWNPSNLGVSAMLFLAPQAVASLSIQWGNNAWPMIVIWALGIVIISRLRRFHICATYLASFVVLAIVRAAVTGATFLAEVAPVTGPMYQLYVFFMITDPRTTVRRKWGQILVAFLVALVEMMLRLAEVVHAPYYALFLVGPAAFVTELWWDGRRREPAGSVGTVHGEGWAAR